MAVALAARRRPLAATGGFVLGLVMVGWLRSIGSLGASPTQGVAVVLGLAVLLSIFGLAARSPGRGFACLLGGLPGMAVGWIWQPCVGAELGSMLNRGPAEPVAVLPLTAAYLVGVTLAVVAVAQIRIISADTRKPRRLPTSAGVILGTVVAVLIGAGIYRDVVGWLALVSV
jgi:hypothetical protein